MANENVLKYFPYLSHSRYLGQKLKNSNNQYKPFVKKNCLHNNVFDIQDPTGETIGLSQIEKPPPRTWSYPSQGHMGSGAQGVVRSGTYISRNGSPEYGAFKLFFSETNPDSLDELRFAIELNKLVPDSVIHIELVESCDVFSSIDESSLAENVLEEKLIIVGLEEGFSFSKKIESLLGAKNYSEVERHFNKICDACDKMNRVGFFHRDIKPENVIFVIRSGTLTPVVIDFDMMCYMSNIETIVTNVEEYWHGLLVTTHDEDEEEEFLKNFKHSQRVIDSNLSNEFNQNPPLDAFYLSLLFYRDYDFKEIKEICFKIAFKFYRVLRALYITDNAIRNINHGTFYNYFKVFEMTNTGYTATYFDLFLDDIKSRSNLSLALTREEKAKYLDNRFNNTIQTKLEQAKLPQELSIDLIKSELNDLKSKQTTSPVPSALTALENSPSSIGPSRNIRSFDKKSPQFLRTRSLVQ